MRKQRRRGGAIRVARTYQLLMYAPLGGVTLLFAAVMLRPGRLVAPWLDGHVALLRQTVGAAFVGLLVAVAVALALPRGGTPAGIAVALLTLLWTAWRARSGYRRLIRGEPLDS